MKYYRNLRSYFFFLTVLLTALPSYADKKTCAKAASRLLLPQVRNGEFGFTGGDESIPTLFRMAAPSRKKQGEKMINLAHHYRFWFERQSISLRLIIPDRPADFPTLNKVQKVLEKIPLKVLANVKTIVVNPRRFRYQERFFRKLEELPDDYQRAISAVTEVDSQERIHIHLFPAWVNQPHAFQLDDLRHELGHAVAVKHFGNFWPGADWFLAATKDNRTISDYASTDLDEDFADAVALYLETEAGTKAPKVRREYSHRFKILDEIFGIKL